MPKGKGLGSTAGRTLHIELSGFRVTWLMSKSLGVYPEKWSPRNSPFSHTWAWDPKF